MIEAKLFDLDWLEDDANLIASVAATSLAVSLDELLSRGARSGKQYKNLPYRSSNENEPEQEQSDGDDSLRSSIAVKPAETLEGISNASRVGFFDHNYKKLEGLELNSDLPQYRGTLNKTANDNTEWEKWEKAIADAFKAK